MSDIIRPIEPFFLTQGFGENPQNYAKYGLKAHNGWDIKTKYSDTPQGRRHILSSWLSKFYKQADEGKNGYGKYFEVLVQLKNLWKLTYGHCHSVFQFEEKNESEPMGISDNTGNSTGPHTHLTTKIGKIEGGVFKSDNYNNGYFGAVDPQIFFDELREFKKSGEEVQIISVEAKTYERIVGNSTKWDGVVSYLEIQDNPSDTPLDKVKEVIGGYKSRTTDVQNKLAEAETEVKNREEQVGRLKQQLIDEQKLRLELTENLNKATKSASGVVGSYEGRIATLQEQVNGLAKEKGQLLIKIAQLEKKDYQTSILAQKVRRVANWAASIGKLFRTTFEGILRGRRS